MSHNAPEVLRSSKALHKRVVFAHRKAANRAGRYVRDAIRDEIPPPSGAGNFPGYAATGTLRAAVAYTEPKPLAGGGWTVDVVMKDNGSRKYQRIHELGGVIRARNKPYLVFKIKGRWVRVKQVRIRRKRYFATGWRNGVRGLPQEMAREFEREIRIR